MSQVKKPTFKEKYNNFINGEFVAPVKGEYFDNVSPIDGKIFTKAARSTEEDVHLALDAAHEAFPSWSTTSATERSNMLLLSIQSAKYIFCKLKINSSLPPKKRWISKPICLS